MGIELYWDDEEQTVMLAEVGKRWTWQDYEKAIKTANIANSDLNVDFRAAIVDVRQGVNLPDYLWSGETMHYARWTADMAPQGTGPIVIVGANRFLHAMFNPLKRLFPVATANIHLAPTLDAARTLIADLLTIEGERTA